MKASILTLSMLIGFSAFATNKITDPFSVGIVGRVCNKEKCQNYSQFHTTKVELSEESAKPGSFIGEAKFSYEIEGVKLISVISVSDFEFSDNNQINIYMKTSEDGSSADLGSSEVIVSKMSELNSIAQYSVAITHGDLKIEPAIVLGPSEFFTQNKVNSIFKGLRPKH